MKRTVINEITPRQAFELEVTSLTRNIMRDPCPDTIIPFFNFVYHAGWDHCRNNVELNFTLQRLHGRPDWGNR